MHDYDIHKAPYKNCETRGPWVKGSCPRADKFDYIAKEYEIFEKIFNTLNFNLRKIKCMFRKPST